MYSTKLQKFSQNSCFNKVVLAEKYRGETKVVSKLT